MLRKLKQNPSLGFIRGRGEDTGDSRRNWFGVGLLARHSDLGSLAVQSVDAKYPIFCTRQDGPHPLGFNFQVKEGGTIADSV